MTDTTFNINAGNISLQLCRSRVAVGQYELMVSSDGDYPEQKLIFLSTEQLAELKTWIESN